MNKNASAVSAINGIYTLLLIVFVLGGLYIGQSILVPLILGILFAFLLSPLIEKIERWVGRVAAVLILVFMIFCGISVGGYFLTGEIADLAKKLPEYKENIDIKFGSVRTYLDTAIPAIWKSIDKFNSEFSKPEETSPTHVKVPKSSTPAVIPVKVIESKLSWASSAQTLFSSLIHILITTGFVLLLVIFILINREDLRDRLMRLIARGRIGAASRAMEDASQRISHYLFMQLLVNISYGTLVAIGLYFLGIPNAALWGGILALLRFIPYIGTWLAALIPIILSFVVSTSWLTPLFTFGLYLVLDLIVSNFVEPMLYGFSIGVSPTALIVAIVFWTVMWGPVGTLLATPLTVCLAVLGRHVSKLEFLSILLSDERPLSVMEEFYHRLLSDDIDEALTIGETYRKENTLTAFYDFILMPVITQIENDLRFESSDREDAHRLYQSILEITQELHEPQQATAELNVPAQLLCLPARTEGDEIAGTLLCQLLMQQKIHAESLSAKLTSGEIIDSVIRQQPAVVCLSIVASSPVIRVRHLCAKLREELPQLTIIVGLWGLDLAEGVDPLIIKNLETFDVDRVFYTLGDAIAYLTTFDETKTANTLE